MFIRSLPVVFIIAFYQVLSAQDITVRGQVFDSDSISPMPFAYAVNNNSSIGTLTDVDGKFTLRAHIGDTLSFSHLGYGVTKIFTHTLKGSVKDLHLSIKVVLKQKASELKTVSIISNSFSKERKESYVRRIDEYNRGLSNAASSPITAMYYLWSKKGKELKKLSGLYDQLLIDEFREFRLSPEKVRMITGNDTLDVKEFLPHCFLPDQFIMSASDYELFFAVKQCYSQYMAKQKNKK